MKYTSELDKRPPITRQQVVKTNKHNQIIEAENHQKVYENAQHLKSIQNVAKQMEAKDMFEQQPTIKMQTEIEKRDIKINEKFKAVNGITAKPEINPKSRSLQRTIEDLYIWEQKKQRKLESERNKANTPVKEPKINKPH